jgi:hypothetical protein
MEEVRRKLRREVWSKEKKMEVDRFEGVDLEGGIILKRIL